MIVYSDRMKYLKPKGKRSEQWKDCPSKPKKKSKAKKKNKPILPPLKKEPKPEFVNAKPNMEHRPFKRDV